MIFPNGIEEIRKFYGDPRPYIRPDGTVYADWERHTLALCELPAPLPLSWDHEQKVRRIRCHHLLVDAFGAAFRTLYDAGNWGLLYEFGGCYNFRPKRTGAKLSLHAWGAAVDLNVATNQQGTDGDMPSAVIQAFEAHGFQWGGRWSTPDPHHFQGATGY